MKTLHTLLALALPTAIIIHHTLLLSLAAATTAVTLHTTTHTTNNNNITMKLSLIALTALFAAPSASAFMAPQPAASNSALFSTMGGDAGLATGVGTPKVNTPSSPGGEMALTKDVWDTLSPIKVQGGSLRTWSFTTPAIDSVQVHLKTEGRPLNANGKTKNRARKRRLAL